MNVMNTCIIQYESFPRMSTVQSSDIGWYCIGIVCAGSMTRNQAGPSSAFAFASFFALAFALILSSYVPSAVGIAR